MLGSVQSAPRLAWTAVAILMSMGSVSAQEQGARPPVLQGVFNEAQRIAIPQDSPLRRELTIAVVAASEIQRRLELPATVEADPTQTAEVLPPASGRIVDLKVELGDRVAQNQELATIHVGDLKRAGLDKRKAFRLQPVDDRLAGVRTTGFELQEAQPERPDAQLEAHVAPSDGAERTQLRSLKAPMAGSVTALRIASGTVVTDLRSSLLTIANLDSVWVTANVPSKDTAVIAMQLPVEIGLVAYPNEVFRGTARFINNAANADTSGAKVGIALQNPDRRLKPNMSAIATFFSPKQIVSTVPAAAVIRKKDSNEVLVEVEPWVFEARSVEIGFQQGTRAIVTSGLVVGERVAVTGGAPLADRQRQCQGVKPC